MDSTRAFIDHLFESLHRQTLVKLTLSKPRSTTEELTNVYARLVEIRSRLMLSCTLRYKTKDETRNISIDEAPQQIANWLETLFRNADLFTTNRHYSLQISKKARVCCKKAVNLSPATIDLQHDHAKNRPLDSDNRPWLQALGITNQEGKVLQQGQRKFRQINKYIELIGHLFQTNPLREQARIVDMGSGKGYLTFALYDYLHNQLKIPVRVTGVELRPALVEQCNQIASDNHFDALTFVAQDIHTYEPVGGIDMLIALHACDTATDEALAKGIRAGASIIVVAPCCHKQVRKDMEPPSNLWPF
ncbi:MAG: SAM-dependent methyltransferase [Saprospiraceae bacterium]